MEPPLQKHGYSLVEVLLIIVLFGIALAFLPPAARGIARANRVPSGCGLYDSVYDSTFPRLTTTDMRQLWTSALAIPVWVVLWVKTRRRQRLRSRIKEAGRPPTAPGRKAASPSS
jgi:hypothetical protein